MWLRRLHVAIIFITKNIKTADDSVFYGFDI